MPLKLGGAETARPEVITWNPYDGIERREAYARWRHLRSQGWQRSVFGLGKMIASPPPTGPNVGVLRVLTKNGDDRYTWDRTNPREVREAFSKFKEYLAKGYTAYAVTAGGQKGHRLDDFDPSLGEVVFAKLKEAILVPPSMPG